MPLFLCSLLKRLDFDFCNAASTGDGGGPELDEPFLGGTLKKPRRTLGCERGFVAHTHSFQGDVARVDDPVYVLGGSFTDRLKSMASKALYSPRP
ncbi:uncharacterized protein LAJ45_10550 [Morchella importuna]|uniref:uncharacterized protein n=1 Tax=Morchella importuna TaxID=1174673 RepID=UPI001E8E4A6A|nr:uncharacterized protein LAJ45_10550 [Morchella importuna]KAH8145428.1 hypothetical protein LAJ45_10550 [Morchella importuna]